MLHALTCFQLNWNGMETLTFDVDSAGTTPRTIFWFRFPVGCKIVGCTVDGEPVDYDFDPDTFTVTIKS